MLAFDIGIDAMVWAEDGCTARISLVRIDGNLNADWYNSDILRQVLVPYLRGLTKAIFQEDNARSLVARCILTFSIYRVFDFCPDLHSLQM